MGRDFPVGFSDVALPIGRVAVSRRSVIVQEFEIMLGRLVPTSWGWVKVTFVLLGLIALLGVILKQRKTTHILLEIGAFLGLCVIFGHGVLTRGVLGTSVSHPHEWYYYLILLPHVMSGLIYLVLAIVLFYFGWQMAVRHQSGYLKWHRRLGYWGLCCLWVSVILSLPL